MAAPGQPAGGASVEHGREPCPDRILDDMGSAFGMGAVGGGIFHFLKAVKNSPRNQRTRGGLEVRKILWNYEKVLWKMCENCLLPRYFFLMF